MLVPACAASFDCARATSRQERLICSDSVLSKLDVQLGQLYKKKESALSPGGAALLQKSERSWLRYVATVCSPTVPTYGDSRRIPKNCIEDQYRERLKQLAKVAVKIGPYVFNRVDLFAAEPDPTPGTGSLPAFYVQHVAYPQIDYPRSPQVKEWNKESVQFLSELGTCDGGHGDYDTDYAIGYATPRVISVGWVDWFYCHGTPHGQWQEHSGNVVLQPTPRLLTAGDLFGPGKDWAKPLQALFWRALQKSDWQVSEDAREAAKSAIDDIVVQPDRWEITQEGLQVAFNAYEVACYACTPPPVTVSWAELKPLLSRDAVVP